MQLHDKAGCAKQAGVGQTLSLSPWQAARPSSAQAHAGGMHTPPACRQQFRPARQWKQGGGPSPQPSSGVRARQPWCKPLGRQGLL